MKEALGYTHKTLGRGHSNQRKLLGQKGPKARKAWHIQEKSRRRWWPWLSERGGERKEISRAGYVAFLKRSRLGNVNLSSLSLPQSLHFPFIPYLGWFSLFLLLESEVSLYLCKLTCYLCSASPSLPFNFRITQLFSFFLAVYIYIFFLLKIVVKKHISQNLLP